jgi:hypothetical protein
VGPYRRSAFIRSPISVFRLAKIWASIARTLLAL